MTKLGAKKWKMHPELKQRIGAVDRPKSTLTYVAKFQSIPNVRTHNFWIFIFENLRTPFILRVLSLVENLRKLFHFLKNAARVEITITVNEENCTNI